MDYTAIFIVSGRKMPVSAAFSGHFRQTGRAIAFRDKIRGWSRAPAGKFAKGGVSHPVRSRRRRCPARRCSRRRKSRYRHRVSRRTGRRRERHADVLPGLDVLSRHDFACRTVRENHRRRSTLLSTLFRRSGCGAAWKRRGFRAARGWRSSSGAALKSVRTAPRVR